MSPKLADIARRVMEDYPDFEVVVVFGFLFRAVLDPLVVPAA